MVKTEKKNPQAATKGSPQKKSQKPLFIGLGIFCFALIIWAGTRMPQGTIKFGICKVFLERTLTYPTDFNVVSAYEKPLEVRMEYTAINEYGEYILSSAICSFRTDQANNLTLSDVEINRMKVPQDDIARFNKVIPVITADPPDLTLPAPLSNNLIDLQR